MLRLIFWIALHVGRSAGRALLYPITLYFLITAGEARRGSRLFLRRALGHEPSWRDQFRHIHCFAATILDRVYFLTGRLERFDIEIFGGQWILDQAASGRGCILLGSHLGSFEALRAIGLNLRHFPIRILMNTHHNPVMTRLLDALNPELAQTIIPVGGPETLIKVQQSVEQGCLVGALGDRVVPDEKAVHCRFFGQSIALPIAPILLAALAGCPVILCFGLYRGGHRYQLHFELLAEQVTLDRRHRQEQLGAWAQRYADRLEHYARDAPYNWFNFYDYWQEIPSSRAEESRGKKVQRQSQRFARQSTIGWDGLGTLLLSNALLLATLGLSGLWFFHRVWRIARDTPCQAAGNGWIVVLGMRLQRDQLSCAYVRRLERAATLYQTDPQRRILLVGGQTGGSVSEAEHGRRFLVKIGLPTDILSIEDQSLHTLDNLRHIRQFLGEDRAQPWTLVTSRYHLARSQTLACGLGLRPVLCAAEERLRLDPSTLWRLLLEAGYLHWYKVGRLWARWTGQRHSLARIT